MKKGLRGLFVGSLAAFCAFGLASCGESSSASADLKVGVILVGDETEGYTKAHMDGIEAAAKKIKADEGKTIEINYKKKVAETNDAYNSAVDLVANNCSLVISNSYGHQSFMANAAKEYPNINFVACTGDFAAISGISNLSNAFTDVYQARYVSGIVAGMKLKELIDGNKLSASNKDSDGNWKIGYVGAFTYAEVVSGYTAFFLGVQSIVSNVSMDVQFTNSWFDIDKEGAAAELLVNRGCVIIGQHADSTGAPAKCEAMLTSTSSPKVCYSVGYNVDMLEAAPTAALTSSTNNWEVYYEYAFKKALAGEKIAADWAEGYETGAVGLTALGKNCATGTQAAVDTAVTAIKNGSLHVFDTSKFKVSGKTVTTNEVNFSYMDYTGSAPVEVYHGDTVETVKTSGSVSYVEESVTRSAPYFSLAIDGINLLNK
ncbi:MAG: BMP family ABC transporter substrate-binding protein [Bacilli bacterium]